MKTIMIILTLLFSLNTSYAMQPYVNACMIKYNEYKQISTKNNSKVSIPKKFKNNNLKRFSIIVVVIVLSLLVFLSIGLKKP
jgi:hypothetical protein